MEKEWQIINEAAERALLVGCGLPYNHSSYTGRGRCPTFVEESVVTLLANKTGAITAVQKKLNKLKNQNKNLLALSSRAVKQGFNNFDYTSRIYCIRAINKQIDKCKFEAQECTGIQALPLQFYRPDPELDLLAAASLRDAILEAEQAIGLRQARDRIQTWDDRMLASLQGSGKEASRWAAAPFQSLPVAYFVAADGTPTTNFKEHFEELGDRWHPVFNLMSAAGFDNSNERLPNWADFSAEYAQDIPWAPEVHLDQEDDIAFSDTLRHKRPERAVSLDGWRTREARALPRLFVTLYFSCFVRI